MAARDFEVRPSVFIDEQQKNSFDVYIPILRQARERLKSDGVLVLHLGKSVKCDMADHLQELGKRWFRSADLFDESVVHCDLTAFVIRNGYVASVSCFVLAPSV